jgi:uncharacterized protein
MIATILAGAGVGLASSFHCALMCGPLAGAACTSRDEAAQYSAARAIGYTVVGAVVGAIAAPLTGRYQVPIRIAAAAIAAIVIARAGLKLLRRAPTEKLVVLRTRKPRLRPWLLGLMTSVFPCGALLSGLVIASSSGSALEGALTMTAFAVASTPGLVAAALAAPRLVQRLSSSRRIAGALLIALAAVTVAQAALFTRPTPHACCVKKT